MRSAVKIALEARKEQAVILDSQSKIANWLYNRLLERANDLRKRYRESQDKEVGRTLYTERGLRDLIPDLKAEHPFLKAVYSSVLKNAALRLSKAIRDYQDGKYGRRANTVPGPSSVPGIANGFPCSDGCCNRHRLPGNSIATMTGCCLILSKIRRAVSVLL